jgi:Protein of unknown function (DUF3277)
MGDFHTYSPDLVITTFSEVIIGGYANDTFIEVERDEDSFMKYTGSLGDVARSRNLNRGGKVTLTLMATSQTNDALALIVQDDEDFGQSYFPLEIKDLSGNMVIHCEIAWIQKMPKIDRGKESGTVQWVFDCADMEVLPGGNIQ